MTREEERETASRTLNKCETINAEGTLAGFINGCYKGFSEGFIKGAEWADKTMLDKACKWLKNNARNYYSAYATEDRLIEDFKKYMEE